MTSLSGEQPYSIVMFYQKFLGGMFKQESSAVFIRLKAELFGHVTQLDIGFISVKPISLEVPTLRLGARFDLTYALQMVARAASRSRATNISIR